jgi:hypothetical protein
MVAFCGAHLIEDLTYLRAFLPSWTEKDNHREGIVLPCENPEGNDVKQILITTLYSHRRYSHEEVEIIEEIKPPLFRQMRQVASRDTAGESSRPTRASSGCAMHCMTWAIPCFRLHTCNRAAVDCICLQSTVDRAENKLTTYGHFTPFVVVYLHEIECLRPTERRHGSLAGATAEEKQNR